MMHPRPSPIAASLYTLRDLNADVIVMHGPHGCCFRTGRLLESDGVRVVLQEAYDTFNPKLMGIVGTCASMIIGEDLKEPIENLGLDCVILPVESHGGFGEGDNTEGAIAVLNAAVEYGVIPQEEADRQNEMLRLATHVEKTRGMAQGKYIKPNFGESKEKVAKIIVKAIQEGKKVAFVLNAKKETSYLFADILNCDFSRLFDDSNINSNKDIENLHFIANLDENIGLPRIRQHAVNITKELNETGIDIECITGGLDEYPITPRKAEEYLMEIKPDLVIVAGVPHALYVEELDCETIAVTDGPRLVQPLNELGYSHVITELDAHSKTLGVDEIVDSDFGMMIRSVIEWELE